MTVKPPVPPPIVTIRRPISELFIGAYCSCTQGFVKLFLSRERALENMEEIEKDNYTDRDSKEP